MQRLFDSHSHSIYSPDGSDSIREMTLRASTLGLVALAITDHCEANAYYSEGYDKRIADSVSDIFATKKLLDSDMELLCGIELGQPLQGISEAEQVVSQYSFDMVLGSLHNVDGLEDFAFLDYENLDLYDLLNKYYSEIYEMIKWGKFDSLAHLTYPLRYIRGVAKMDVDMARFDEQIREIMELLVKQNIGLEINTSGLRQHLQQAMPDLYYVKMFRECKGEILTLGSDAHRTADLAKGIADAVEIAKAAGFKRVAYFKNRKPVFVEI